MAANQRSLMPDCYVAGGLRGRGEGATAAGALQYSRATVPWVLFTGMAARVRESHVVLEYGRGLLGLGWMYSPLVLGLIRDKGRLLRSQVNLSI